METKEQIETSRDFNHTAAKIALDQRDALIKKLVAASNRIEELEMTVSELRALDNEAQHGADELTRSAARYEKVRRMNVHEFKELYDRNLRGEGAFDELVDQHK
jgi:multidrug resistance efflux pump